MFMWKSINSWLNIIRWCRLEAFNFSTSCLIWVGITGGTCLLSIWIKFLVQRFWGVLTYLWDAKTLRVGAIDGHIGQALANIMYSIIECFINTFIEQQVGVPPATTTSIAPPSWIPNFTLRINSKSDILWWNTWSPPKHCDSSSSSVSSNSATSVSSNLSHLPWSRIKE